MDKIATLVKEAEVRGVLAGLVDAGHLKVASYEDLEALTSAVSSCLDQNYDLDDVLSKTAEVLDYLENEDGIEKEAGEIDETAVMAAFGELSMMKMAGQIDDETFAAAAEELGFQVKEAGAMADLLTGKSGGSAKAKKELANFPSSFGGAAERANVTPMRGVPTVTKHTKVTKPSVGHTPPPSGKGPSAKTLEMGAGSKASRAAKAFALRNPKAVMALKGLGGAAALAGTAVAGKALYDKYAK